MSIATEAALMFDDSFAVFGDELIIVMPQGTKHSALISDNTHAKEISDTGNVVSMERMNIYFQKGDTKLSLKNTIKAREKLWRIETLGDDEIAWNLSVMRVVT